MGGNGYRLRCIKCHNRLIQYEFSEYWMCNSCGNWYKFGAYRKDGKAKVGFQVLMTPTLFRHRNIKVKK